MSKTRTEGTIAAGADISHPYCPDEEIDDHAGKLKVCGHPIRLKLLCLIACQEDSCVNELWSCLDQPQPVVSQHLGILKSKGIVGAVVKGNRRIYSITDPFIRGVIASILTTLSPPGSVPSIRTGT